MIPPTISELRKVFCLMDLPEEHLQWILDRSVYDEYQDRELIVKFGDPIDEMWFIIEGGASFYMLINNQPVFFYTFENNKETGGVTGLLPYSRMKASSGNAYALGFTRRVGLHKKYFEELEKMNPEFVKRLISYMTDRARVFATVQLQHEKVSALGKLAAGIAHELNNPASAISRLASELDHRIAVNFDLTKKLLIHCVDPKHIDTLHELASSKKSSAQPRVSALKRMEVEDEMQEWFTAHGVTTTHSIFETFISSGVRIEDLDSIYNLVSNESFCDVIVWFENLMASQKIVTDLDHASGRISTLVGAIKGHVHMDRTFDMQPTKIVTDIENALMLLGHKLREKNIEIERKYADPVPDVDAYVGELNQVWMNILDNAIYAMGKNGHLQLEVFPKNSDLKVNIIDDGPGIPADVLPRIFDPFFSTKKVGEGTGIGLDIVNRIVRRHSGEIKVNSKPGRTEFNICIPMKQQKAPDIKLQ